MIDSARPRFSISGEFLGYVGASPDINETKQAELNTRFINQLNLTVSQLAEAEEIIRLATRELGEYLGVDGCYLCETNPEVGLVVPEENRKDSRHGFLSMVGERRIDDFVSTECCEALESGEAAPSKT